MTVSFVYTVQVRRMIEEADERWITEHGVTVARTWREMLGALMCAMIAGRVVHLVLAITVRGAGVAHELDALFLAPWPGIVLQLAVLPPLALLCRQARA